MTRAELVVSKLVAGREKDLAFAEAAARNGLVNTQTLLERLGAALLADDLAAATRARIERIALKTRT